MSAKLEGIITKFTRGSYAPVHTDSKDEAATGLVESFDGSLNEKSNAERSNLGSFLKPVLQCFLVVALMIGSYAFGVYSSSSRKHSMGFVPDIPFIPGEGIFTDDHDWIGPGKDSDDLWAKEYRTTSDQKFIKIEDPAAYDTPTAQLDPNGLNYYSISVYHQLHCLAMFRGIAYGQSYATNGGHHKRGLHKNRTEADWWHLGHCFNYIRQAIRCTVDTTLEFPPHNHTPGMKHNIRRTGNRQCRDISALDAFVEDNKWENNFFNVGEVM